MTAQSSPFDRIANKYRVLWDESDAGSLQREAVWRYLTPLAKPGDRVLDLGCGTGEDALRFASHGSTVIGIDASPEMVRIARERGVDARPGRIEDIGDMKLKFDGVVSIFGPLNCVADLSVLRDPLAAMIAPGGYLAVCFMGRFCLVETLWYLMRGRVHEATRRWKGSAGSSLGLRVVYPSSTQIREAFSSAFRLESSAGIGILVPPSFVRGLSGVLLRRLDRLDRLVAAWPICRAMGDHRLLIFRRA